MGNYLMFVGGSGARAYRAFLHCCASGIIRSEEVKVLLLDADQNNDANQKCLELYRMYKYQHDTFSAVKKEERKKNDFYSFGCNVQMYSEKAISPVYSENYYLGQSAKNDKERRVMKWFYTEEERKQDLEKGFYARPNIGCVFFQQFQNDDFERYLGEMEQELQNGKNVNLILTGSVFGGTGASGIPSIIKLVRKRLLEKISDEKIEKLHCCTVLMTPYFRIARPMEDHQKDIIIQEKDFFTNTVEGLKYYRFYLDNTIENNTYLQSVYFVGKEPLEWVNMKYEDGGTKQKNKPHVVELYAALAIREILQNPDKEGIYGYLNDNANLNNSLREAQGALADMIRTQVIFANCIYEYLREQKRIKKSRDVMVPQWSKKYHMFEQSNIEMAEKFCKYSVELLEWTYMIQGQLYEDGRMEKSSDITIYGNLFKTIGDEVGYIKDNQQSSSEGRKNWRTIKRSFNELVDTCSNIEYVVDKVAIVLSYLGCGSNALAVYGCAGLMIKLFHIIAKKH